MWRFLAGVLFGVVLAIAYVRFNVQLPRVLQLPSDLRGGVVSAATESELYALEGDSQRRLRALEIYFANRAGDAAQKDAAAGHPFLNALHDARARREAQQLRAQWTAFDKVLAQPGLRSALEQRHGTTDSDALKLNLLLEALDKSAFLKGWLERNDGPVTAENVRSRLDDAAKDN